MKELENDIVMLSAGCGEVVIAASKADIEIKGEDAKQIKLHGFNISLAKFLSELGVDKKVELINSLSDTANLIIALGKANESFKNYLLNPMPNQSEYFARVEGKTYLVIPIPESPLNLFNQQTIVALKRTKIYLEAFKFKKYCSEETCYGKDRDNWREDNAFYGHGAIICICMYDKFKGRIKKVTSEAHSTMHYWNEIGGFNYDFTGVQFDKPMPFEIQKYKKKSELLETIALQKRFDNFVIKARKDLRPIKRP